MARGSRAAEPGRAVGYVRRSTDRQEQSIGDQKAAIERFCVEQGLRLARFYVDDAISGTSAKGRGGFQSMIEDAGSGARPFDTVVVYDVKRFGRVDNDEAGYYRHLLRRAGVEVLYVSEGFGGTDADDLLRPVKQWQARQESKDLSKVTIRGLLSKSATGTWMGGAPPHGYDLRCEDPAGRFLFTVRYLPDGSKQLLDEQGHLTRTLARGELLSVSSQDRARLVPSAPERVQTIRRIFQMYAREGRGYKAIADAPNADGTPTARGPGWSRIYSGRWTDTTVRAILLNPIYAGDMVWNRRTDARFHRIGGGRAVERPVVHGQRLVANAESDWLVVRDAHPALIDRQLAEEVKQRMDANVHSLAQRGRNPRTRPSGHGRGWGGRRARFILSGIMTCALCGSRYQGRQRVKGRKRWEGSGVRTYAYACGGYIVGGKSVCRLNPIPQELLEEAVIDAVLDFYRPYFEPGGERRLAEAVRHQLGSEAEELTRARQRVAGEREELEGIINNLLDNLTAANREFVDRRLEQLRERKERLQRRDEELERLELAQASVEATAEEARDFLRSLAFTLREGVPQEKLAAIRRCVQRIWVNRPASRLTLRLRSVPAGQLDATVDQPVTLDLPEPAPAKETASGPEA